MPTIFGKPRVSAIWHFGDVMAALPGANTCKRRVLTAPLGREIISGLALVVNLIGALWSFGNRVWLLFS